MTEISVKYAARFKKRKAMKSIRNDYRKALAELITNSDDSYKRLEEQAKKVDNTEYLNQIKEINIYFNTKKRLFEVVDFGEGLTKKEMEEIFEEYGSERETHYAPGRALFGQGLFDVMYCSESGGEIHSLKLGELHRGKARWRGDDQKFITVDKKIREKAELRKKYRIPERNGTNVSFFFKAGKLKFDKVYRELCNFYMLRFINSNPNRKVTLTFVDGNRVINSEILKYSFPSGKKIDEINKTLDLEGYPTIEIYGELYESDIELSQRGINRAGGLLFYDEDFNVYDITLFSYDPHPNAQTFWGKVQMIGLKQFVIKKLSENEEILTDTRDGFDKHHLFYNTISEVFEGWLESLVEEKKSRPTVVVSKSLRRKDKKALTLLNEIYDEINKALTKGGPIKKKKLPKIMHTEIEFDRNSTVINVNEEENVTLFVNTEMVEEGECVILKSDNPNIELRPEQIVVKKDKKNKIQRHPINLIGKVPRDCGMVTATYKDATVHLSVAVIENVPFIPENGIEFNPKQYSSTDTRANRIYLYVDLSKVELGDTVSFDSPDNENIVLTETSIKISNESFAVQDGIMKISTLYRGYGVDQVGHIVATVGEYSDEAEIRIVERDTPSGMFEKYTFMNMGEDWDQSFFHKKKKEILINLDHKINREYFGQTEESGIKAVEEDPRAQMLLSEILLWECLQGAVSDWWYKPGGHSGDGYPIIMKEFNRLKNEYGAEIYKIYVK